MFVYLLASLKRILRTAIRAFGMAGFADIEKDSWMAIPQLHAGLFARAKNAALRIEVGGGEFDGFAHGFRLFRLGLASGGISDCRSEERRVGKECW